MGVLDTSRAPSERGSEGLHTCRDGLEPGISDRRAWAAGSETKKPGLHRCRPGFATTWRRPDGASGAQETGGVGVTAAEVAAAAFLRGRSGMMLWISASEKFFFKETHEGGPETVLMGIEDIDGQGWRARTRWYPRSPQLSPPPNRFRRAARLWRGSPAEHSPEGQARVSGQGCLALAFLASSSNSRGE